MAKKAKIWRQKRMTSFIRAAVKWWRSLLSICRKLWSGWGGW
jgi:hypothetical protein